MSAPEVKLQQMGAHNWRLPVRMAKAGRDVIFPSSLQMEAAYLYEKDEEVLEAQYIDATPPPWVPERICPLNRLERRVGFLVVRLRTMPAIEDWRESESLLFTNRRRPNRFVMDQKTGIWRDLLAEKLIMVVGLLHRLRTEKDLE
ncbi:hypothetical protein PQR71_07800 [Paraburkholderia fungorum]|uniref:hypothetical protein n=1 Tax=Paraburkholderia fungorum TaxID=134537 RepID=UPI0038BC0735